MRRLIILLPLLLSACMFGNSHTRAMEDTSAAMAEDQTSEQVRAQYWRQQSTFYTTTPWRSPPVNGRN